MKLGSDVLAPAFRGLHARRRALADQGALELRERPHHVEDQPPPGRRRVNALGEGHEPGPELAKRPGEARPLLRCSGKAPVLVDDRASGRLQGLPLQVEVLFIRGDAGVTDFHVSQHH